MNKNWIYVIAILVTLGAIVAVFGFLVGPALADGWSDSHNLSPAQRAYYNSLQPNVYVYQPVIQYQYQYVPSYQPYVYNPYRSSYPPCVPYQWPARAGYGRQAARFGYYNGYYNSWYNAWNQQW